MIKCINHESRVLQKIGLCDKNPAPIPDIFDIQDTNSYIISDEEELSCQMQRNELILAAFAIYNNHVIMKKGLGRFSDLNQKKIIEKFFQEMRKGVGKDSKIEVIAVTHLETCDLSEIEKTYNISLKNFNRSRKVHIKTREKMITGNSICDRVKISANKVETYNDLMDSNTIFKARPSNPSN